MRINRQKRKANALASGHLIKMALNWFKCQDTLAEWLTRGPAKAVSFGRAGSNPAGVVFVFRRLCGHQLIALLCYSGSTCCSSYIVLGFERWASVVSLVIIAECRHEEPW